MGKGSVTESDMQSPEDNELGQSSTCARNAQVANQNMNECPQSKSTMKELK